MFIDLRKDKDLTAKQWAKREDLRYCILPKLDLSECSIKGRNVLGVNFRLTNLTAQQLLEASDIRGCKLPKIFLIVKCP